LLAHVDVAAARRNRVEKIARERLGIQTSRHLRLHVGDIFSAELGKSLDEQGAIKVDMLWIDFGSGRELPKIKENLWRRLRPNGLMLVHSTLTNAFSRLWLRSLTRTHEPGGSSEFEMVSLLEPHKQLQNSVTVLRRTSGAEAPPVYSWEA
jgi:hypothetical protein